MWVRARVAARGRPQRNARATRRRRRSGGGPAGERGQQWRHRQCAAERGRVALSQPPAARNGCWSVAARRVRPQERGGARSRRGTTELLPRAFPSDTSVSARSRSVCPPFCIPSSRSSSHSCAGSAQRNWDGWEPVLTHLRRGPGAGQRGRLCSLASTSLLHTCTQRVGVLAKRANEGADDRTNRQTRHRRQTCELRPGSQ